VAKPDAAFFQRIVAEAGAVARDITYIGDSIDNDVLPALAAGLDAIHVASGPWGMVQARWPEARSLRSVPSLVALPPLFGKG
jgi:FMN phosphatase YigB (HAD superfamily)